MNEIPKLDELGELPEPKRPPRSEAELLPGTLPQKKELPGGFDRSWTPEAELIDNTRPPPLLIPQDLAEEMRALLVERARRRLEALKLYQPMPVQWAFHKSTAKERILRGSNRSGKTVGAAVEIARCVTGQDPLKRYPEKDGIVYCVGKDGREVGQVIYRKLFRAGAFKIIRDDVTGEWRSFMPNDPKDAKRADKAKPAPPLIPARFIKSIAWESKKESIPKLVTLHNGWELHFYTSNAKPPHGSDIDLAWFDEEIIDRDWYPEIAARLVDRNGYFIWSATPQAGTDQLYELHENAEAERKKPAAERNIEEFVILIDDNAHLTSEQKKQFAAKLSDEERAIRVGGEFALRAYRVFPEYDPFRHEVDYFEIPRKWTRYVAIDPGRQICAALFLAIPPPEEGDYAYLYDELYIQNCSADLFGEKMRHKCVGQNFEAFVIDHTEARKYETGSGRTIEDQYSDALRKRKLACARTGCQFTWGAADPSAGAEAVRAWLRFRDDGTAKLRVMRDRCPNFIEEIKRYRYKRVDGVITDKPEDRGRVHAMAAIRYLVQDNPIYKKPKKRKPPVNPVWQAAQDKKKGKGGSLNFGPGELVS